MSLRGVFGISLTLVALGCSSEPGNQLSIYHAPSEAQLVSEFLEFLPIRHHVVSSTMPEGEAREASGKSLRVSLTIDLDCVECYQLDRDGSHVAVHAGDELGLQYGLAHVLEEAGTRFFHPFASYIPKKLTLREESDAYGRIIAPQQARRGLHLHTLHPTEGYYAFWEPGEQNLEDARRIVDWTIKNRGNYMQWVALANIYENPSEHPAWKAHTSAILDYLHGRGLEAGVGIQLFSASSLQQGFNLINFDEGEGDEETAIAESYDVLLDELPFDNINLSFGEFFSAEAQRFIDTVDLAYTKLQEAASGTEMSSVIHVGKNDELLVDYEGDTYQYYFLVQFANENIVPWVHTTMYYNLFEDAGGAYHHDDFFEHRDFLLDRLEQQQPVAYFPETAYWVAFDNSVPTYVPLYLRTRWLDLSLIREETRARNGAELEEHILFSSGWEWGYWQNDYAALRSSHTLPESWEAQTHEMYSHWGDDGAALADAINELADAQSAALIEKRLAAYLAGRDIAIDAGSMLDIVSQPDRPSFEAVAAFTEEEMAAFRTNVLAPLAELAEVGERAEQKIADLDIPEKWLQEIRDGIEISTLRTRFAHEVFSSALEYGEGSDIVERLQNLDELLVRARVVVDRRKAAFFYPDADRLTTQNLNATIYQWGYLRQAHDLCYWIRERVELARLTGDTEEPPPTCLFQ